MPTTLITRPKIEKVFSMRDYVSTIEKAFKLYGQGKVQMPPKLYITFQKGDLRCMPAYIPAMKMAGVKNVNVHPENEKIPAVMATITLIDPDTGYPLAIMDGTHITDMRTGAAGAIAAKYLSRKDSEVAAFVGAGAQARTQLEGLMVVRPKLSAVRVSSRHGSTMKEFARFAGGLGLDAECADSVQAAVKEADIVVTTTPVRKPIVKDAWISEGTHINAIGADAAGKEELEPKLLKRARIVIDNWEQASHSGEINVPLSKGIISKRDVYADIGEIVTGKKKGRTNAKQITVFDSTGLAIQDISSAGAIYRKLLDKGVKMDFF